MAHYRYLRDFPCFRTRDPLVQVDLSTTVSWMLGEFVECVTSRNSRVITAWPRGIEEVGFLQQLAVVWHTVGTDDEDYVGVCASSLTRVATLEWPFTNDSLRRLDGVLADRRVILPKNKVHLNGAEHDCYSWHIQIRRIVDLNPELSVRRTGRLVTLKGHEELQNPTLAEISPIIVTDPDGNPIVDDCRKLFLGRVRKYTQTKASNVPGDLFDIATTPYLLMGLHAGTETRKAGLRLIRIRRPTWY